MEGGRKETPAKAARGWIMKWRTHSCVPRRDSSRRLLVNWRHTRTSVEMSLDTARTSAYATIRQRVPPVQPLEAEDEFERARR
jgi:hypothetical protein